MLMPSRVKHRKQMRGRNRGTAQRGTEVAFGEFGLQALEPIWLESRQIEATRRVITRYVRRGGKVWIRVFPDKPVTKKPAETRMGKGKGAPDHGVAVVKPGHILFELAGVTQEMAKDDMRHASDTRPVKHPLYKKRVPQTHKSHAHDERGEAHIGDVVRIGETRPISKSKTWRLLEILRKADHTTA